jgi:hypothetical protein
LSDGHASESGDDSETVHTDATTTSSQDGDNGEEDPQEEIEQKFCELTGCNVMDGEGGVLFVKKSDGRATGDAFVMFATEDDGKKALAKHRQCIGSRYIELFRSTTAEVQQVSCRMNSQICPYLIYLMLPRRFSTAL